MFGTAGLPHILMRFFTVPDAKEARKSVFWATTWIGYFYVLTFIIGFGAITLVLHQPGVHRRGRRSLRRRQQHGGRAPGQGGRRQRVPRLHLGGGLRDHPRGGGRPDAVRRLGGVARPLRHGDQEGQGRQRVRAARCRASPRCALGVVAVVLGIVFEKQNIAFMVSLAFAIAASANFPVLFMSVLWKDCTTRGAVIGGFLGLISSVALTVVSPSVWEATLGNPAGSALVPLHLAGAVLDDDRASSASGCSRSLDRSAQARQGTRRLRGAAGALGNRPGRVRFVRPLSQRLPHGAPDAGREAGAFLRAARSRVEQHGRKADGEKPNTPNHQHESRHQPQGIAHPARGEGHDHLARRIGGEARVRPGMPRTAGRSDRTPRVEPQTPRARARPQTPQDQAQRRGPRCQTRRAATPTQAARWQRPRRTAAHGAGQRRGPASATARPTLRRAIARQRTRCRPVSSGRWPQAAPPGAAATLAPADR